MTVIAGGKSLLLALSFIALARFVFFFLFFWEAILLVAVSLYLLVGEAFCQNWCH